jgi:hypothetical protein
VTTPRARAAGDLPVIAPAQIRAALERRTAHRREAVAELRAALAALAAAVSRQAGRVDDVRRAVEARGGDLEPLRLHDSRLARLRLEMGAAGRTLGDVPGTSGDDAAAPR